MCRCSVLNETTVCSWSLSIENIRDYVFTSELSLHPPRVAISSLGETSSDRCHLISSEVESLTRIYVYTCSGSRATVISFKGGLVTGVNTDLGVANKYFS